MSDTTTPVLEEPAVEGLRAALRGDIVQPGDEAYDEARKVYNGMIDRRPRLIARCADAADVIAAVNFARENDLLLAVRGGGHNGAGSGVVDEGLVVDLSAMRGVRVDPKAKTVRVEGGCIWKEVDHATHAFGLAVPTGFNSTTGVGGLTLGGGHGYLTRKYGLTIDNLISADVVLADGNFVVASEEENEDLFWALRGGGGNFGVVTSFLFRAHPVHTVVAGPTLWHLDRAAEAMRWYDDFTAQASEDMYGFFAFLKVPPGPPFPEDLHLKTMCGVVWCYTGPPEEADEAFRPVREFGPPALDLVGPMPLPALNSMFDPLLPPGLQWYWKHDFMDELSDEAIAAHVEHGSEIPTPLSTMHLYPIDGCGAPGRQGRHRLQLPWCPLVSGGRRHRPGPGQQGNHHRVGAGLLGGVAPPLGRRRLRQHDDGGGPESRGGVLPRQLRTAGRDQEQVRPAQPVPREPEHKTDSVNRE